MPLRFFHSRGVPAPSNLRKIRLRLNAPHESVAAADMFCVRADGTAASRPSRSSGRSCARQTRPAAAVDSCRTGPHSLSILLHHLLLLAFALPVPPPFLFLLWNISAPFVILHPLPHCAAGIASIGYQLLDSLQVHLGFCFYSGVS